jgi:hypothetical protein
MAFSGKSVFTLLYFKFATTYFTVVKAYKAEINSIAVKEWGANRQASGNFIEIKIN